MGFARLEADGVDPCERAAGVAEERGGRHDLQGVPPETEALGGRAVLGLEGLGDAPSQGHARRAGCVPREELPSAEQEGCCGQGDGSCGARGSVLMKWSIIIFCRSFRMS